MGTAALYARISQDREGAGLGVNRQLEDARKLAELKGFTDWLEFTDDDISAYAGRIRPGYEELKQAIREGRVEAVIVWHADRLHRRVSELIEYAELCTEGRAVPTYSVQGGDLDLSSSTGRMVATILGAVSEQESAHKGERISRKRRQAAERGIWQGGPRPFGWSIEKDTDEHGRSINVPVIKEEEAELVRWAHEAVLEGRSISSVVLHFQRSGVLSSHGNGWRHSTVRTLLHRSRNAGLESLKGEIVGPSSFPALVSEATWREVVRILKQPERRKSDTTQVSSLLSGLMHCHCGELLVTGSSGKRRKDGTLTRNYVCISQRFPDSRRRDIQHVGMAADPLDDFVSKIMPQYIAIPFGAFRLFSPARKVDLAETERELAGLQARQEEAAQMWADGEITRRQLATMNSSLEEKAAAAEATLAELTTQGQALPDLAPNQAQEFWDQLDLLGKRAVIRQTVGIVVFPTGGRQFKRMSVDEQEDHLRIVARPVSETSGVRVAYWQPTVPPVWPEDEEE
ncbi:recombinase family protein [Kocuria rosea]|uniref:recombinase family protein n=1 Tax=Kocuria rosea TaxID=1275 RepID=UPI0009DCDBB8|nr:recombinase family protein [Kocuria polaris]